MTRINIRTEPDDSGEITLEGWFDADKATVYSEATDWDGNNRISRATGSQYDHESLYRTAQGRWVLRSWSQNAADQIEVYRFIDAKTAREWLILQDEDAAVAEHFGAMEEEHGPDVGGQGQSPTEAVIRTYMKPDGGHRSAPERNGVLHGSDVDRYDQKARELYEVFAQMDPAEKADLLHRAFPMPVPYRDLSEEDQTTARLWDWEADPRGPFPDSAGRQSIAIYSDPQRPHVVRVALDDGDGGVWELNLALDEYGENVGEVPGTWRTLATVYGPRH